MSLSDSTSPAGPRRLAALAALQVAGVFAGAQLGKIAPLVGWYRDEAGMSLVAIGFLTAILGFFVAIAALPTAFLIDRLGNFRSFVVSSAVLAVGGILLALADGSGLVLAARFIEALGYLVIVICTPALLANYSPDSLKAPMLAIWGGFVPIGFAIADFSAAAMLPASEAPLFLLAMAGAFTVFALLAMLLTAGLAPLDVPERSEGGQRLMASFSPAVLMVSLAFGAYVVLSLAFFTFLPAYVSAAGDAMLLPAGGIALLVPAGNILASLLMGGRHLRFATVLGVVGFLACAASAVPFYTSSDALTATIAAAVYAVAGGIVASALFAAIPFVVPRGGSAAIVIGFVAQSGGITTLAGPPVAGWVIESFGWPGLGWLLAAVSLAGACLVAPLLAGRRGIKG